MTQPDSETANETDQYDTLLRSMEPGLLISVNNATDHALPSGELTVKSSRDDETNVFLTGFQDSHWRIHREMSGDLVYDEIGDCGESYVDDILTIEILGME
jgi:hypothetical protein